MVGRIRTLVALLMVALATLVLAPLVWLGVRTGLFEGRGILRLWHRVIAAALGIRVHVSGTMTRQRPLLIASNHISWTDITALGSVADVSFIARHDLAGWPLVGWLSRLQRTVFIEREERRKSGQQAGEIAERLAKGDAMVLFAEGTTGDGNVPMPFKSALFGAASMILAAGDRQTVWIQPVAIAYTRLHGVPMGRQQRPTAAWIGDQDLVPHLRGLFARPAVDVELHFGEPIAYEKGTSRKQTAQIMETEVRRMMLAALAAPAQ